MRVLLIQPPIFGLEKKDKTFVERNIFTQVYPPLGLAYIAAFLEQNGFGVKILDCIVTNSFEKEITAELRGFSPGLVGINNSFTMHSPDARRVAVIAKKWDKNVPVVFGGTHASVFAEEMLKDKNIDLVVRGEGEQTFLEIAQKAKKSLKLHGIAGTVERSGKRILSNKPRPLIKDLDSLPFPARHLLPMKLYHKFEDMRWSMRSPKTTITTSRGCPGTCVFCSVKCVWGVGWRARSAKNVADEIEMLASDFGIREIDFEDDNLTLDKKRMHSICDEIINRGIDIKWKTPNGIAYYALDKGLLAHMKKSGCHRIQFGIESACPETQKFIGKTVDLKKIDALTKAANNLGLWVQATFIIGFPFETRGQIMQTVDYAINSDLDYAEIFLPAVFPGTRLFEIFKEKGFSKESDERGVAYDTAYLSKKELEEIWLDANKKMKTRVFRRFANPLNIARKIRSVEDLLFVLRLGKSMLAPLIRRDDIVLAFRNKKFSGQES